MKKISSTNNPAASSGVCCSHKVLASGLIPFKNAPEARTQERVEGIKPSPRIKVLLAVLFAGVFPAFLAAEQAPSPPLFLASYQPYALEQADTEQSAADPALSINRPLRQIPAGASFAARPRGELPIQLTLDGYDHPLTQQHIRRLSTSAGIHSLNIILQRSQPYMAFIRGEVERRGVPMELMFLPIIESSFVSTAVSRAGAAGLWQFMRNSIGPYDMRITPMMDERRDFWKATMGALDKLEDEYRIFGCWKLTLAAYNAGVGRIQRAMRAHPGADYWELGRLRALPGETINFVPRLLAVSFMVSNPRMFGIEAAWPENPHWTRVPVGRSVDLHILAEYAGINAELLRNANRELNQRVTPPYADYHLNVPAAHAPAVIAVLADPERSLIRYHFHTIQAGDTISALARRYGVSEQQIRNHNPGIQDRFLRLGHRLVIPAF